MSTQEQVASVFLSILGVLLVIATIKVVFFRKQIPGTPTNRFNPPQERKQDGFVPPKVGSVMRGYKGRNQRRILPGQKNDH